MSEVRTDSLVNQSGDNDSGIDLSTNDVVAIKTANSEALRVDSSGNVGIATTSPSERLDIQTTAGRFKVKALGGSSVELESDSAVKLKAAVNDVILDGASSIIFDIADDEKARIDSSGNLLVSKTSANSTTDGIELRGGSGAVRFIGKTDSNAVGYLNRGVSDGDILQFAKDNSTVGAIGSNGGRVYISGPAAGGIKFDQYGATNGAVLPCTSTGAKADDLHDFGVSDARWDDIYATNGTIQTSDQNEKQQIASLTDAEIAAAKAISQLFKTFKWNDKVAAKGDAARTHTGVIAQDVEAAMTAAGLDAGDYAFFISSTWWEHSVDVPAVAEETDEDGNVTVEAQEAYTRTDTYDTAEEAPEGATERNRKGIRYPELLSFVGAATEQRLANIETRLTALENA